MSDTDVETAADTDPQTSPSDTAGDAARDAETTAVQDGADGADTAVIGADNDADDSSHGADGDSDSDGDGDSAGRGSGSGGRDLLVREGDIAADYLERLLDIADYDGDIDLDVENDRAIVAIVGGDLRALVGPRGETLDALQELTRLAVQQQTGTRSRLMLDVSGHRQARRSELRTLAVDTATRVLDSGEPVRLAPMNPFERKVVHDAISEVDGVLSESEGEEPHRRVVVLVTR